MPVVNLIPGAVQLARRRRDRLRSWAAAAFVAMAAVAVAGGLEGYRRLQAGGLRTQGEQLRLQLEAARDELRTLTVEEEQARRHVERAAALRSKRAWSGLLAVIGSCMPDSCWLVSMGTDPATPAAAKSQPQVRSPRISPGAGPSTLRVDAPRRFRLEGYAADAADPQVFVSNLKRTRVFADVRVGRSQREVMPEGSFFRFELICEW